MSEKQTQNPEASKQTIADLYQQAANYLETLIHYGRANIEPGIHSDGGMLHISAEVPELNGKRLFLSYDRPTTDNDVTTVDTDIPLAWTDETGKNHWVTPISVKVFDNTDKLLHEYDILTTSDPEDSLAYDRETEDAETGELATITALDAKEITAHIDWALEQSHE